MTACEHPTDNHSDDLVEVWYGKPTPVILCGFHVMQGTQAALDAIAAQREHGAHHDYSCICWRRRNPCGCFLWDQDCPYYEALPT